jgi:tetratricopeptide (TPR) repeat protein
MKTQDYRSRLHRAWNQLEAGQGSEAREKLEELLGENPDHSPTRLFVAMAQIDEEQWGAATENLLQVLKREPGNTLARSTIAFCLAGQGQWDEARKEWAANGHHASPAYRVRLTEWVEREFLKANGWPWPPREISPTAGIQSSDQPFIPETQEESNTPEETELSTASILSEIARQMESDEDNAEKSDVGAEADLEKDAIEEQVSVGDPSGHGAASERQRNNGVPELSPVPVESRVDWELGPYKPRPEETPLAQALLEGTTQRLGWWQKKRLESTVVRAMRYQNYPKIFPAIYPLLYDPRCDLTTLWVAAFVCEVTGHPKQAVQLCERVTPREYWPDHFRALYARCLLRLGRHHEAAEELAQVTVTGPEDFGVHWSLGVLVLAQNDRQLARRLFRRAHTSYMVDTIDTQWWVLTRSLESP